MARTQDSLFVMQKNISFKTTCGNGILILTFDTKM